MLNFFRQYRRFLLLLVLIAGNTIISSPATAQTWPWLTPIAGEGSQTISSLAARPNDGLVVGGHFQNELLIGNTTSISVGNTDAFLAGLNATGQEQWVLTGESAGADKTTDVALDAENNIYWAGEYWFDGTFGELNLSATKSSKAIFLLKVTNTGIPIWARSIEGTGNKLLGAMTADAEGNTYLSGNFSDSLFIENVVLTASAEKDFFLLKFSSEGDLLWANQAGIAGEIQPRRMSCQNDLIAITGSMRGQYNFGTDTIQNNTNDSDAFLAVYDADGSVNWGRKIGGVNEQAGSDVAFDNDGNIYAAGSFFGLVRLRTDLEFQSPNLNDNLYFIKYNTDGFPLAARSIGDLEIELSEALVFADGHFYWSGFFKNSFNVDGFNLQAAGDDFNTFILEIDTSMNIVETHVVTSSETVLLSELAADTEGQIYVGGALNGTATFDGQQELAAGNGFDGFVGQLTPLIVATEDFTTSDFKIYPNPATDYFTIESPEDHLEISVFTMNGKEILRTREQTVNCQNWPFGIYILRIDDREKSSGILIKQ